jgi:hypothetical protein|nr:MAG TPA: hypothetical protein [Caudoviricetes sp.]
MDKTQTKRLQEFAKSLEGLTYPEWLRLKTGIDAAFEEKRRETERNFCLTSPVRVCDLIQSRFG